MPSEASFLGRGWAFPPTFVAGGSEVEMAEGVEDIHQSLTILLSTERGERVMPYAYESITYNEPIEDWLFTEDMPGSPG